jgi:hypothetical protein
MTNLVPSWASKETFTVGINNWILSKRLGAPHAHLTKKYTKSVHDVNNNQVFLRLESSPDKKNLATL